MLGFVGTRQWVYPQSIDGRFQRIRRWTFAALHVVLFATPWIVIAGNPALRLDLPGRTLYAFGAIFTPRDTILLLLLLLFLAFSLFFFTALFGRIWCGYACPQTVLLDTWIRPVERWLEGDRNRRMRRDAGPWTLDRVWRKAAKWTVFAAAATVVAMTLVSYLAGARELWRGDAGSGHYALAAILGATLFLDFAWFREQFCNYLCPYARFQSVMVDRHSLFVSYDRTRGEPRGKAGNAKARGGCVDCDRCVVVCPQGIDIRNGFQLECITCARCVDACTDVMGKLGHPTLVRYSTLAKDEGASPRRVRPRTVVYATLLSGIAAALVLLLANRTTLEAAVARAPGSLFTVDDDGWVRNTYLMRVANNAPGASVPVHVQVDGLPGAQIICQDIALGSAESRVVPLVVRIPAGATLARTIPIRVTISSPAASVTIDATFKTGGQLAASPAAD